MLPVESEPTENVPGTADISAADLKNLKLEDHVTYRVSVLAQMFGREAARMYSERWGLSLPKYRVLTVMANLSGMSLRELTDQTQMDKGQISRVVSQMELEGLIARKPDDKDARRLILTLTSAGADLYKQTIGVSEERQREILSVLTTEELTALRSTLDKLSSHMRARLAEE
jgi:DNA-binding MarR family transcriptional regulator